MGFPNTLLVAVGNQLAQPTIQVYDSSMKAVTVRDAQDHLAELVAEACRGEEIVLTDGARQVVLIPRDAFNPEMDSEELEAALLKSVNGRHAPLREDELRELAHQAQESHRTRPQK